MKTLTTILIIFLLTISVSAAVIYVDDDGPADFNNINDAVFAADNNDVIIVHPGIYCYKLYPFINIDKPLTLSSVDPNDPCIVNNTIINSIGGLNIDTRNGEITIKGFFLTSAMFRGAIRCDIFEQNNAIIENCVFRANKSQSGGAISARAYSSPKGKLVVKKCIFMENSATRNGGAISSYCSLVVENCVFMGNSTVRDGGAIYCDMYNSEISNCTFIRNYALEYGGGLFCQDSQIILSNSIFWDNTAEDGNEIALFPRSIADINYCNVKEGQAAIYRVCGRVNWGPGNIDVDPCFVDSGYWDGNGTPADTNDDFFVEGDYHLLPVSLCINSGDPAFVLEPGETDLDGIERVIDDRIDMGCYESDALRVPVKLSPSAINVKSFGCFITAIITLPKDITPADIDKNDPLLFLPGHLNSRHQFIWQSGFGKFRRTYIMAVFNKSDCMQYLNNGQNEVTVIGSLISGQFYYGTDKLFVIPWNPWFWWFH